MLGIYVNGVHANAEFAVLGMDVVRGTATGSKAKATTYLPIMMPHSIPDLRRSTISRTRLSLIIGLPFGAHVCKDDIFNYV